MDKTVAFARNATNVFLHILTQCNLKCRHCYINPAQHGTGAMSLAVIEQLLTLLASRQPEANVVFLGGEPTLHRDLPAAIRCARRLGYRSITVDTNGYLFNDILERVTPDQVDFFSFSLDGPRAAINDPIRGQGSFERCTDGIRRAKSRGFRTSLIYTVSSLNLTGLAEMVPLLQKWRIDHFFIQVIGLRGNSADTGIADDRPGQLTREQWQSIVPAVARQAASRGIAVTYPRVFLDPEEPFECAGKVADNFFAFPNGRIYRCPLCEDFPLHSMAFNDYGQLQPTPKINENDLFTLKIDEGCVMNKLIQPGNLSYDASGRPLYQVACCLLKTHVAADTVSTMPQALTQKV